MIALQIQHPCDAMPARPETSERDWFPCAASWTHPSRPRLCRPNSIRLNWKRDEDVPLDLDFVGSLLLLKILLVPLLLLSISKLVLQIFQFLSESLFKFWLLLSILHFLQVLYLLLFKLAHFLLEELDLLMVFVFHNLKQLVRCLGVCLFDLFKNSLFLLNTLFNVKNLILLLH